MGDKNSEQFQAKMMWRVVLHSGPHARVQGDLRCKIKIYILPLSTTD